MYIVYLLLLCLHVCVCSCVCVSVCVGVCVHACVHDWTHNICTRGNVKVRLLRTLRKGNYANHVTFSSDVVQEDSSAEGPHCFCHSGIGFV